MVKLAADGLSEDGETSVMLLEECAGGDLGKRLRLLTSDPRRRWPHRAMDEADAKFYCACVVLALQATHALQITHRDVKPANILIDAAGYAKLGDYGSAKSLCDHCGPRSYLHIIWSFWLQRRHVLLLLIICSRWRRPIGLLLLLLCAHYCLIS